MADLAGAVGHDGTERAGARFGSEILVNLRSRGYIVRPNGKGIETCASALVIVARILDRNGEFVLLGELETSLNVLDLQCIYVIIGNGSLETGTIVYAPRIQRTQGAFLT
jgi:hypothetical protein